MYFSCILHLFYLSRVLGPMCVITSLACQKVSVENLLFKLTHVNLVKNKLIYFTLILSHSNNLKSSQLMTASSDCYKSFSCL